MYIYIYILSIIIRRRRMTGPMREYVNPQCPKTHALFLSARATCDVRCFSQGFYLIGKVNG